MSATDPVPTCDICVTPLGPAVYVPKVTRRDATIHVCPSCGLVQSRVPRRADHWAQRLSSDADWGNVRHGKGARFGAIRPLLERHIDIESLSRVVDIGSNRGDFVLWLNRQAPGCDIWAVEPDAMVVDSYRNVPGIRLIVDRFENVPLPQRAFDLAFSSHTLEHARSALEMIQMTWAALQPGGYALIEVPNLQGLNDVDIVEEFFIDKHTFHFDAGTLTALLSACGFKIVVSPQESDPYNLAVLAQREGEPGQFVRDPTLAAAHRGQILAYAERLEANRALLRRLVDEKLRPLAKRQRVAYWGAGRIFDALVKYGGLTPGDVTCLVDSHLAGKLDSTNGVAIERPERLRLIEPHVVCVLGRSAEEVIARTAYAFGVRHVLKFSELLAQVRDVPDPARRPIASDAVGSG